MRIALLLVTATVILAFSLGGGSPALADPDGKILFHSRRGGMSDVYVMNADGSGVVRIGAFPEEAWDWDPGWGDWPLLGSALSPDGSTVALWGDRIYLVNSDGSGRRPISSDSNLAVLPAWSPDGTKIAYVGGRLRDGDVCVVTADGTAEANLTNNPADYGGPAWSPDGAQLLTVFGWQSIGEIYLMNADGSGLTNLTNDPADESFPGSSPDWSPDGARILFTSDRDGNWEVYVMNADGTGATNLSNSPDIDYGARWSPDGAQILFTRDDGDGNADVYVMNADGSAPARLTDSVGFDGFPAWSPDGSQIAFTTDRDGNREIYVMNADGSGKTNLTNNPADDWLPDWQPGGAIASAAQAGVPPQPLSPPDPLSPPGPTPTSPARTGSCRPDLITPTPTPFAGELPITGAEASSDNPLVWLLAALAAAGVAGAGWAALRRA